ncbi:conserved protein of unknown function (plasmid) [Pararobbsia alpina]|uniref:hypothetical protein n=1 Tax=Pararobbsia alpina TaxID=621374 RepID=UPI0039A4D57B
MNHPDAHLPLTDPVLEAAKRAYQERSRELVRTGQRSQESLYFISPAIVRTIKVHHNSTEF